MIKSIVFDFGGVIVDINREKAVEAFRRIGLADADTRLDKYHQTGIFQELEEGTLSAEGFRQELSALCHREVSTEETRQAWLGFFEEVDLRKLDCIEELRRSHRVFVLSNTNPFVMSWACSPGFSPRHKPLNDYCEKLYLSYQIGYTKPAPEIFAYMTADSGMLPAETLFVDDGAANVGIARELGFMTFQPANGTDWRGKLEMMLKTSRTE
ncbi:MAG: HAD family phosphatase [Mediterranea sp.]|jgi:putative hydrolase of the HAD superfamily|nr:HAD family phosphatase [Mediterranea sp.]